MRVDAELKYLKTEASDRVYIDAHGVTLRIHEDDLPAAPPRVLSVSINVDVRWPGQAAHTLPTERVSLAVAPWMRAGLAFKSR